MRSRRKFVDFLLAEVLQSLDQPSQDELEEELGDLKLLEYCRPFLKRRVRQSINALTLLSGLPGQLDRAERLAAYSIVRIA